jgi:hypothetical protein
VWRNPWRVENHEACHAVIGVALNLRITSATALDGGRVDVEPNFDRLDSHLAALIAPRIAEHNPIGWRPSRMSADGDEARAAVLVDRLGLDAAGFAWLTDFVRDLLLVPEVVRARRRVADAIDATSFLTGDEVVEICAAIPS